jgi:hypothetical protein
VTAYDPAKIRKATWLSPAAGVLGTLPFLIFFDLSPTQWLIAAIISLILSYVLAFVIGGLGYFVLKRLNLTADHFLYAYGLTIVTLVAAGYADIYAFVSLAPAVLLIIAAFCYLRGKPNAA